MIQRIVSYAIRMPFIVLSMTVLLIVVGVVAYQQLDIEAYPNPCPPLVEVLTQPPGWSAEETERYVTVPLEIGLSGMPGLDHIRSFSLFGLSDVKCYFTWNTEYKDARQEVINRLQFVQLPSGLQGQTIAVECHRRGVSLSRRRQGLHAQGPQDRRGLDSRATVQAGAGRHRRHELRRRDEAVPRRDRSVSPARTWRDARARFRRRFRTPTRTSAVSDCSWASRATTCAASASSARRADHVRDIEEVVVAAQKGTPVRIKDVADVDVGSRAAPRDCRIQRRPGRRARDRAHAVWRRNTEDARRHLRTRKVHPRQSHPAPGHGHRAVLRPRRARSRNDPHGHENLRRRDGARRRSSSCSFSGTREPRSSPPSTFLWRYWWLFAAWSGRTRRRISFRLARSISASWSTRP